ncbi:MAG: hypothetical protein EBR34_15745 [Sphingomonadaceae bacterium]|nr:hypothetical protein [Sphingomonadaceae bacterium]
MTPIIYLSRIYSCLMNIDSKYTSLSFIFLVYSIFSIITEYSKRSFLLKTFVFTLVKTYTM